MRQKNKTQFSCTDFLGPRWNKKSKKGCSNFREFAESLEGCRFQKKYANWSEIQKAEEKVGGQEKKTKKMCRTSTNPAWGTEKALGMALTNWVPTTPDQGVAAMEGRPGV